MWCSLIRTRLTIIYTNLHQCYYFKMSTVDILIYYNFFSFKVPAAEIDVKLALGTIDHIVARATVMECNDPCQTIHGAPLGDNNMRVSIYCALEEKAIVPFPVQD